MYIGIDKWVVVVTSEEPFLRDDCTLVEREQYSDYEKLLLHNWALSDEKWNLITTDEIEAIIKSKKDKIDILEIASISDQLNLTAWVLDIVVDYVAISNPEILKHEWIINSKAKLEKIKTILNS